MSGFLERVHFGNFGKYSERQVGPFQPGLNVVYGHNEAGKSTTVAFIKQMLFGWDSKREAANPYLPASGDRVGSLFFNLGDGEVELRREKGSKLKDLPKEVYLGGARHDNAYADICGGVDEKAYAQVFSFSEDELKSLDFESGITSRLFTAGSGTEAAPAEILESVSAEISAITSSRGIEKDALGTLHETLRSQDEQIRELEDEARSYANDGLELVSLESAQVHRDQELSGIRHQAALLENARAEAQRQANILESKKDGLARAHDHLSVEAGREQEFALAEREKRLLGESRRIEKALAERDTFMQLSARAGEREEKLSNERAALALLHGTGCKAGPALRNEINNRRKRLDIRDMSLRQARRQAADADTKLAGIDGLLESGVLEPGSTKARPALIVFGALLLLAGAGMLFMGLQPILGGSYPSSIQDISMLGGGGLLFLGGILLIVLGIPKKDAKASQEKQLLLESQREEAVRLQGEARQMLQAEQAEYDEALARDAGFLEENGLEAADGNLDAALELVKSEEDYLQQEARVVAAEGQLKETRDRIVSHTQTINLSIGDFEDGGMATPETAVMILDQLAEELSEARAREAGYRQHQERIAASRAEIAEAEADIATAKDALSAISSRIGIPSNEPGELPAAIGAIISDKEARIESLNDARVEEGLRIGALRDRLDKAAHAEELEQLRISREETSGRIRKSVQRYAQLLCEREMLIRSIDVWEHEKQPEVYRLASEIFEDMTGGEWTGVISDGNNIRVLSASRTTQTPDLLSTGTRQQLYLSLRIALLLTADATGANMPVVCDDILVHFDHNRRIGAARALSRLASKRQVIVFTCHRETRDLLSETVPGANVLDIG